MSAQDDREAIARVERLWKYEIQHCRFVFSPTGNWWFKWSHRLFLRPRTSVRDFYLWVVRDWATEAMMPVDIALDHDGSPASNDAPRKMWFVNGWSIRGGDEKHLKPEKQHGRESLLLASKESAEGRLVAHPNRWPMMWKVVGVLVAVAGFVLAITD